MDKYFVQLEHVTKRYESKNQTVDALKDISLDIKEGEIFGVIGLSGAGKSTLIRCINLLERPTEGNIIVGGQNLTRLNKKQLRLRRQKIGMIFQHFNLLEQETVLSNVCFPMKIRGVRKKERVAKAKELLEKVGLGDKLKAYPSQLSGGQKQRVAIARVLANDPDLILCDEATSALDPQTTKTILEMLKKINEELGITMIVITHEMKVVSEICHQVAVLDKGVLKEKGEVSEVFANPKSNATKRLLLIEETLEEEV